MTENQELLNAITILLPSVYLLYNYNNNIILLLLTTLIHLPFSFIYHLKVYNKLLPNRIDNNLRRLDHTFQHVSIIIFSYIISKSILFLLINIINNIYSIYYIWDKKTSNDMKRWENVCLNGLFINIYLLYDKKYYLYLYINIIYLLCGFPFIPNINKKYFYGYGQSISHCLLVLYANAIIKCID
jgi:hypothetical protein